jgi:hypothetical protein
MSSHNVILRDAVYDKLQSLLPQKPYDDVAVEKTYFPQENLEDLEETKLKVVGMAYGTERSRQFRYSEVVLLNLQVQVAIQRRVDPTNTDQIDRLQELIEECLDALEADDLVSGANYVWQKSDPLRDENGLVYSYEQLRIQGVFNAIFTLTYQLVKE